MSKVEPLLAVLGEPVVVVAKLIHDLPIPLHFFVVCLVRVALM